MQYGAERASNFSLVTKENGKSVKIIQEALNGAESANIFGLTTQEASNGAGRASNFCLITQENGKSYKIIKEALNGVESANIFYLTTQEASNGAEECEQFIFDHIEKREECQNHSGSIDWS